MRLKRLLYSQNRKTVGTEIVTDSFTWNNRDCMHECQFREYHQHRTIWVCQMTHEFTVTTKHLELTGKPGDYLIITQDGEMAPVAKESFEQGGYKPVVCPREYCEATDCACSKTLKQLIGQSDDQLQRMG